MTIMKLAIIMTFLGILGYVPLVEASGRHEPPPVEPDITLVTNIYEIKNDAMANGMCASGIDADWSTTKHQMGMGAGVNEGDTSLCAGYARKYNEVLYKGIISCDVDGEGCAGVGSAMFRF